MIQCFTKHDRVPVFAPGTEPRLLSASYIQSEFAEFTRILHKHEDRFELLYVQSGSTPYVVGNKHFTAAEGDMIICNSGILHDELFEKSNAFSSYSLSIDNLQLQGLPPNHFIPAGTSPIIHTEQYSVYFSEMMGTIYHFLTSDSEGIENPCHHLMMAVLTTLYLLIHEEPSLKTASGIDESSLVKRIKEYVDQHYSEDLSLQSIGKQFFISQYYLSHVFKKETGYSPMQYILRRRIGESQSLLITTSGSITSIASQVGFGNPNNFNIQFTKYVGISPRSYRKIYTK